ncbi:MAG: transglycosylase SLT domain-containing protein [Chloracidobacterium sp.]|nr:transglycosylase SLT domain-containing protein [Chloracidobacterium sp.]
MMQWLAKFGISTVLTLVIFTVGCSAQQTEEQALAQLREMTSSGKLPPENIVADIETRFANKKTGALAKLLRARIRFENKDYAGAAAILNSDVFKKRTKLADHALWLRGKALQAAGNHAEALNIFAAILNDHADSIRVRDAKLLWAQSAIAAGRAVEVPPFLIELSENNDADAMLLTAKAYESQGSQTEAIRYYRKTFFYSAGSNAAKEAEMKLTSLSQPLTPQNSEEQIGRAERLFNTKNFADALTAYGVLATNFPASVTPLLQVRRLTAMANTGKMIDAQGVFNSLPSSGREREEGYRQLVLGYAKAKMWPQARSTADSMRTAFPNGTLVAKTLIEAGLAARDAKNRADEGYFLNTAVAAFPNAVEVATAQFEAGWFQHENGNYAESSRMFVEHLARYAGKDTTNRGKAGYWAARDSERSGKTADACALYEGVNYRYGANWYGYLALSRLTAMKAGGNCRSTAAPSATITQAVANLKVVSVVAETAGQKELERVEKSDELSTIGLFDWSIDELNEAKKTAGNSPKINLALARHYRWKADNTSALLAMQKSYPDYAQMFPEEMDRETWSFFYPLTNWGDIRYWAKERNLDPYQIAGMIRQESVFNQRAKSGADAYGLMQLLIPTARSVAKKYVSKIAMVTSDALYQPAVNIELGTAYFRDQLDKFGRIEYVAIAYNAGPGRVPQWRATLPPDMDEFVEAIPFKETKAYVQGIIRNSAQYRRLYDDNGNFRTNVGTRPLRGEIETKTREQLTAEFPDVLVDDEASD